MANVSKATLKGFFDAGDQPTSAQFDTLIDTLCSQGDGGVHVLASKTVDMNVAAVTNLINVAHTEAHVLEVRAHSPTADVSAATVKLGGNGTNDDFLTTTALGAKLDNSSSNQARQILTDNAKPVWYPLSNLFDLEVVGTAVGLVTFDVIGYNKIPNEP